VLEGVAECPVPNIKLLVELRVGQAATHVEKLVRGPVVVTQHPIKQIHVMPSSGNARPG
jgi:hypothetical protein